MQKRWGMIFLVLALIGTMVSCRTPAGRTPGDVVDDSTITTKVKAKIFEDGIMKGMAISVDTFEGQVTLTGAVEAPQQIEPKGLADYLAVLTKAVFQSGMSWRVIEA